jgi:Flp pilus assembly protein TadG
MKRQQSGISSQGGFVLVYMAALLTVLLLFTGLAVDTGRSYVVRAQLSKAVDGAALGAARSLNSGDPRGEAARIFRANFPAGYFGTSSSTDPTTDAGFFTSQVIDSTGVNIVTVTASATVPTTFMRLADFNEVTVTSSSQATRRMVDLSLVLDVSSSIGVVQWTAVRDAARSFVNSFDSAHDRVALLTYGDGAKVIDQMPSSRGFNKTQVMSDVPSTLPGGSTAMVEGLYRGWDELRWVPTGSQSGLRVIVLFTDGASNSVPGAYDSTTVAKGLRTYDFPKNAGDTNSQTWDYPHVSGLYDTQSGTATAPNAFDLSTTTILWNAHTVFPGLPTVAQTLPSMSFHSHHRSSGIPTAFPLQTNALKVDGVPQDMTRGLRDPTGGQYPSQVWNINNAARNLIEIVANAARSDTGGDYPIRVYTIGMGQLVRLNLGTRPETSESILKRIANDATSPDFNGAQLEGKYYYALTAADVAPAFEGIQNQIVRLSK